MDKQEFNQKFINDELGIYIIVTDSYNNDIENTPSLRMKLDDDKMGILAWINEEKARAYLNDLNLKNDKLKVVKIFGSDYKRFLDSQGEYSSRYCLNIDFNSL